MEELQLIWGWQPALYLFLGGLGGGTAVVAGLLHLRGSGRQHTVCVSFWFAVACLAVGLLLLLTELITPLRGMMMWQSFSNFSSWMTYGAWIVFVALIAFGLFALGTTPAIQQRLGTANKTHGDSTNTKEASVAPGIAKALNALAIIAIVLGLCVAVYTGILLMSAPGVPLWNTPLLPCLFTVSALDTGVAAVEIISIICAKKDGEPASLLHRLDKAVVALVALEAIALAAFLELTLAGANADGAQSFQLVAAQSATLLVSGSLWPWFWVLFVPFALGIPLIIALLALGGKGGRTSALAGAASVLVGGCALRFLILMAGLHVDYIADTFLALL